MNKKSKKKTSKEKGGPSSNKNPSSKRTARFVLIGVVGGIAGLLAVAIFVSGGFTKLAGPSEQRAALITQVLAPTTANSQALETTSAGSSASPVVTIVEFGDYQCNSCGRFHKETKDQVIANLVETGKAKFMFKDFTINDRVYAPRDGSTLAAEAAYCAGDQNKFWQYHDNLYNNQKREGTEWVSVEALTQFATDVGVQNIDQFSQCLDSHQYRDKVRENSKLAQSLGLNATPTFLIIAEGKEPQLVVGAHPYSTFESVVNELVS